MNNKDILPQQNCFTTGNIVGVARCLLRNGFSVVPLRHTGGKLIPGLPRWEHLKREPLKAEEAEINFRNSQGVAIITGSISDCIALDVDDPKKFEEFYPIEKIKEQAGIVVKTPTNGRFHAYFEYTDKFNSYLNFLKDAGFELKTGGTLCTFYSILPEFPYRIEKCEELTPMPEELVGKIEDLQQRKKNQKLSSRSSNIEYVLDKLHEVTGYEPKLRKEGIWRAKCPVHGDVEPSLDIIMLEGGKVGFKCWAGCEEREIREALGLSETEKIEKEAIAKKIVEKLTSGYDVWHNQYDEGFITLSNNEHLKIGNKSFRDFLQKTAYETEGRLLHTQAIQSIIEILRWRAKESAQYKTFKRVGFDKDFVEVDLKREDGKILRITREDIVLDIPRLKFISSNSSLPLPEPDLSINPKEAWKDFFEIFNIHSREQLALTVSFMLKTFYPAGEYPILAILGNREGVGKTTLAKYIIKMLDPTITPIKPHPKSIDDLFVLAKNNFLLSFDNLTHIGDGLSDALCILSTGGSLAKRQLFTDSEAIEYYLKNPIILTSIYDILKNRDLRRRSLIVELEKPVSMLPEKQLEEKFKELQPKLYGYLCLCVQEALKEKVINLPLLDIADFCEWVLKAEPVFFVGGPEFLKLVDENRKEVTKNILEGNLILHFIQKKLETQDVYEITPTEMFKELKNLHPNEFSLKNANSLGKEIKKMSSDLEAFNIEVATVRNMKGRKFIFKKIGDSIVIPAMDAKTQENQKLTHDNNHDNKLSLLSLLSCSRHVKPIEKSGNMTDDDNDDKRTTFFNNDVEEEEFLW